MWSKILTVLLLASKISAEITAPGIDRIVPNEVNSKGYKIVYGDEDLTDINEVISDEEKFHVVKSSINLNEAVKPLPAEDVKCLVSVDRYCSPEMRKMKSILMHALKEDCATCTQEEKEEAGRVLVSMMAHDPMAWKLFLTRYGSLANVQMILG